MAGFIQDTTGEYGSYTYADLAEKMSSKSSLVLQTIGDTGFGGFWDWGSQDFVGISKQGIEDLSNEIKKYGDSLEECIAQIDEKADISDVLAADSKAAQAAKQFIGDIKVLMQAYVSTIKKYATTANEAYERWATAEGKLQDQVVDTSSEIVSNIDEIKID